MEVKRFSYGAHEDQFADLYRPRSLKMLPVMVIIHGGYWKDNHTLTQVAFYKYLIISMDFVTP